MVKTFTFLLFCLFAQSVHAQFGISGPPHPSAALDLNTTNKAFYPPRLSTTQRVNILNPQPGALVYDLDKATLYLFDGQNWLPMAFQNPTAVIPLGRTASDGSPGDRFGCSVAIDGDYAIIGAYGDGNGTQTNKGSAYIFRRTGNIWRQQAKLESLDGGTNDSFGYSVAIDGDYVVVGEPYDNTANMYQGAAYIYHRNGENWVFQLKTSVNVGRQSGSSTFGKSVAIDGDYALIGAPGTNVTPYMAEGAAYIYYRVGETWTQQARLISSVGNTYSDFGNSVSLSGNYAIVGAPRYDVNGVTNQGAAFVVLRSGTTWTQQAQLLASDRQSENLFGTSIAISGDYTVIGSPNAGINGKAGQGAAYVFTRSGTSWSNQVKLLSSDGQANDGFGNSVAIDGSDILIGASPKTIDGNANQGATYLFKRTDTSWNQIRRIIDNSGPSASFGASVHIRNGSFVIGVPGYQQSTGKVGFGTTNTD